MYRVFEQLAADPSSKARALETPTPTGAPAAVKLLLTEREAADRLGFTVRFLQNRRVTGDGPPFVRISARAIRYRPEDLDAWIAERVRTGTSDPDRE